MDLFDNAVFMFPCGRMKTELSKTLTSQHLFTTYGDHSRAFCLFVFFYRSSNFEFVDGDILENTPRVDADISLTG